MAMALQRWGIENGKRKEGKSQRDELRPHRFPLCFYFNLFYDILVLGVSFDFDFDLYPRPNRLIGREVGLFDRLTDYFVLVHTYGIIILSRSSITPNYTHSPFSRLRWVFGERCTPYVYSILMYFALVFVCVDARAIYPIHLYLSQERYWITTTTNELNDFNTAECSL